MDTPCHTPMKSTLAHEVKPRVCLSIMKILEDMTASVGSLLPVICDVEGYGVCYY
jgi:hypothetical protein